MRFLVDVNASGALTQWLMERGHDVAQVTKKDPSMRDDDILRWAVHEQRIVITTDQDFEEMIWHQGKPHCGILRLENVPRSEREALLAEVLDHYSQDLSSGAVVIALRQKIRIRRPLGPRG